MMNGTSQTGVHVLLTGADVVKWREEEKVCEETIKATQLRLAVIRRRLDAASVFMDVQPDPALESPQVVETDDDIDSLGDVVGAAISAIGGAPKPIAIRQWIVKNNPVWRDRLDAHPNYFYTVLARRVKRGKLVRRGQGYRLPSVSPQGETGAVAAPASS
jgi:hypothetical protein